MDKQKVKMLSTETGQFGETLEEGKEYDLSIASAQYWIQRGKAELIEAKKGKAKDEPTVEEAKQAADVEAKRADEADQKAKDEAAKAAGSQSK